MQRTRTALAALQPLDIDAIAHRLHDVRLAGGTVFLFGNGACAALSEHMATDFIKSDLAVSDDPQRPRLRASSLNANSAMLTALGNDQEYELIFSEQLRGLAGPADMAFGLSASGASPNVLRALEVARSAGAGTACFTGKITLEPPIAALVDLAVVVESDAIDVIEDAHVAVHHALLRRYLELCGDE
ncbi:hypothetical protein NS359_08080 [Curtobacterium oceanosedimentum]|uniref:SIS domain-containing protein n=1 Tax=Curtobacterium oceanosedimentum TaxID=465820 RepID=A0A147DR36_9MICO|nr:hypothetical protein NS359_08080 [Curtobacterium oceanosedimentum]